MPELTQALLNAVGLQIRALVVEAVDYLNTLPAPYRVRVEVVEATGLNYQLGEKDAFDPTLLRDEALFKCEQFVAIDALVGAVAQASGEALEAVHDWTLAQLAQPVLAEYVMRAEHPVAFDEARLEAAVGRALAIASAPNDLVQIHPLTKVDTEEDIGVAPGVRIRAVTPEERTEWLNPGPFNQLVQQQTVMDIGAVIEVDYDGANPAATGAAHETAQQLLTVLQLVLDCDAVVPFNEDRHRVSRTLRAAGYPGSAAWHHGPHQQVHAADAPRLGHDLAQLAARASIRGLQLALRRWRESADRSRDDDQLIDYWIALEALFMANSERRIKETVSRRASRYTGADPVAEAMIRDQLRESYKRRSELVHGEQLIGWNVHAMAYQTRGHLRAVLLKVIEDPAVFDATQY
jgi:hypothetical protein